jgi:hypothetical protein
MLSRLLLRTYSQCSGPEKALLEKSRGSGLQALNQEVRRASQYDEYRGAGPSVNGEGFSQCQTPTESNDGRPSRYSAVPNYQVVRCNAACFNMRGTCLLPLVPFAVWSVRNHLH